ncbi:hypothetical protein QVD17_35829 [Tagetes erecta]|uniref:Uncharacterized protein n=1 Tax=Tagetes erecta TaxID=13708 RepID=A0AAD8JT80_TARER|nr:hypothetical protein QVD17_35829 [Tagetes erecta]
MMLEPAPGVFLETCKLEEFYKTSKLLQRWHAVEVFLPVNDFKLKSLVGKPICISSNQDYIVFFQYYNTS